MNEDKPKHYIELFVENSKKVKSKVLEDKDLFHKIDQLSSFFHNLVTCIDIKWNEEQNKKLNPYFEQIIEENFLEIAKECENFICLLINGFYDGAIKSLRHILENFVIHYYFSIVEKNGNLKRYYVKKAEFYKLPEQLTEEEVKEIKRYEKEKTLIAGEVPIYEANSFFCWKQGKKYLKSYNFLKNKEDLVYFPQFEKECLNLIFKQDSFKKKEIEKLNLKKEISELYKELSKILHNRGTISKYKTTSSLLNNSFNKEDLEKSIELYKRIEGMIAIMLLLGAFPNFNRGSFSYLPKYKKVQELIKNNEIGEG